MLSVEEYTFHNSRIQGQSWLHGDFEFHLSCIKPCFKKKEQTNKQTKPTTNLDYVQQCMLFSRRMAGPCMHLGAVSPFIDLNMTVDSNRLLFKNKLRFEVFLVRT